MKKILIIAPHPDDEIIGCGGTILRNIAEGNYVYVCIVTKGVEPLFSKDVVDVTRKECIECHKKNGTTKVFFLDFPSVMLEEQHRYEINEKILNVIKEVEPDEVFIPHIGDMQKDHQIVAEACMVALRPKYSFAPKKIMAYETLSETGWNIPNVQNEFLPNYFVNISDFLQDKIKMIEFFDSQLSEFPAARSLEAIESLAKYRGAVMNMKAAEAFMLIREIN